MTESVWMLCATVNRPRPGRDRACGVLWDIVEEMGDPAGADPLLLEHVPMLLPGLLDRLLDEGGALRIDLPRDLKGSHGGALISRTATEVRRFLTNMAGQWVGPDARDFYPNSVWKVPHARSGEAIAAIERFRDAPMDERALGEVLELGVWRVSIFPSSLTLSVPCAELDAALASIKLLLSECPLEVDWA